MSTRLKLKKKMYHPPFEEPKMEHNFDDDKTKQSTKLKTNSSKTYEQIARDSSKTEKDDNIFTKAIASANKHHIKLKAGRRDRGYGNCIFEAVINNINDRAYFTEKLRQTPNWYRRIWMDEMMKRMISERCLWNPGYNAQQIREGFEKVKESGVYEIDFFGDMMLVGIACGIRKRILIFNTHEHLLHDPISVVDPNHYDARITDYDETPIVVAYNNYHYENLHTLDEQDRKETIRLAKPYIKDRYYHEYGFTKRDIKYLISPSIINSTKESRKEHPDAKESTESITSKKQNITENQTAEDIDLVENEKIQKGTKKSWNKVIYKKKQTP